MQRDVARTPRCLVFDLGAGSGRAVLAELLPDGLTMTELHRFDGLELRAPDGPRWDMDRIFAEVAEGMRRAAAAGGVDSIGVDSWGVDYGLIAADGRLLSPVLTYRHPRSQRGFDHCAVSKARIGAVTGSQVIAINTIFQLADQVASEPEVLARADAMLMIANLVSHYLSGVRVNEWTLARTSGLHDLDAGGWSLELSTGIGLPPRLLAPLVPTGTVIGPLRQSLAADSGLGSVPVVAVAAHDTASAVLALAPGEDEAFLSAGSWNLLGYEQAGAALPAGALAAGFGSEGGAFGRTLVIRSLSGLHLLRCLRRAWAARRGEDPSFPRISAEAAAAPQDGPAINVADPMFFDPPDMLAAIELHLGDHAPKSLGELAFAVYRGFAEDIARNLDQIEIFRGRPIRGLRLGGGGARDATFCHTLATAIGRPVVAGPIEASAAGNALVQFLATDALPSLEEGRRRLAASESLITYAP